MVIKHRIKCFDSELLVCETGQNNYELTIQASSNPLGFGNSLESFDNEEKAVSAAEHFCKVYTLARERGYYLKDKKFAKADKEMIEISSVFGSSVPFETLALQFEN
ncbi:hypothetical protein MJA45_23370 [Paenibacillus aurantius]|uniref:Uncharacterized protein n=1 Tax=Paenibacillus aurantius TaxID=2918900 RepID=A0AA96RET3_9BACL|nr:hypothetical protein [Paenibacillus aurantius]WNQ10528.1 hypothetical protein MJA45_23370 [Paenibacillus aurantius]